jgi:hypothetical protein
MGIDLCILGNHTIDFNGKNFEELFSEIKLKLDNIKLNNYIYIKYAKLLWDNGNIYGEEEINKISQKKEWTGYDDCSPSDFNEYGKIEFYGPLNLEIDFSKNYITFWDPPYRYKSWFEVEYIHQNEWRKYLYQVIHVFGGNKVIYLPDSGIPSSAFAYYDGTFEELENNLKREYGESKNELNKITNEYYYPEYYNKGEPSGHGYMVEKFDAKIFKVH